jgi:hypothetical protein
MVEVSYIIRMVYIIILILALILSLIYLLAVILIRRFHTANNILTANFCLASVIAGVFWVMDNLLTISNPYFFYQTAVRCTLNGYLQQMVNCLLVYSLVTITIVRFFAITYPNKRLFKRQLWCFISIAVHWTVAIVVPIPQFVIAFKVSVSIIHES